MKVMIFYLIHDKSPIHVWHKGQGICTPCIHWVTLLADVQPYGCFIFLNYITAVKSPPIINCVHFHCSFYEGCIQILNGSVTQITTFSFMWTDFPNYVLLYTWLIDNHIWLLDYFLIVGSLKLILSLDIYLFCVFFTCLFSFMQIDFQWDFCTYVWH